MGKKLDQEGKDSIVAKCKFHSRAEKVVKEWISSLVGVRFG